MKKMLVILSCLAFAISSVAPCLADEPAWDLSRKQAKVRLDDLNSTKNQVSASALPQAVEKDSSNEIFSFTEALTKLGDWF